MKAILSFTLIVMCTISALAQRPEVANVCKVYTGKEGLLISTCRIGEEPKNEVLLKVTGVDHPWNNRIFKSTANKYKNNSSSSEFNIDYQITDGGKTYTILTYRDGIFTAYLTPFGTLQTEHKLVYDEYGSRECRPERFLTEYLEQK